MFYLCDRNPQIVVNTQHVPVTNALLVCAFGRHAVNVAGRYNKFLTGLKQASLSYVCALSRTAYTEKNNK